MIKITILTTNNHIYANKIIKHLLNEPSFKIVNILESTTLYSNKNSFNGLMYYLKVSGFGYVLPQMVKVLLFKIGTFIATSLKLGDDGSIFYSYYRKTKGKRIKHVKVADINDPVLIKKLKKVKTDLFVSVYFNQLLKKDVLCIPPLGVINIHPAYLPKNRGMSPTFWVLANKEKETGVSVHFINRAVDEGNILGRRRIMISKEDTEASMYWKCTNAGIPLLTTVIRKITSNSIRGIKQKKIEGSYFSIPTKTAVKQFRKNKRKFYTFSQLFSE